MDNFSYSPIAGLLDIDAFPSDPATETIARQQFMTLFNQLKDYLNNTVSTAAPSGTVLDFAGINAPAGWLVCDGAAISRTVYSGLFSAIGTTWGTGDGSTTFNLPNLTDKARYRRAKKTDLAVGTYQEEELKAHTHTYNVPGGPAGSTSVVSIQTNQTPYTDAAYSTNSTGGTENRPVSAVFLPIIKF